MSDDAEYGCWAEGCVAVPEWSIEPMDGSTLYLACGDGEDMFQAIATMVAHGAAQVVVQAWQPFAAPPVIREDGIPHHVEYDPLAGHRCLPDCPSCLAAGVGENQEAPE